MNYEYHLHKLLLNMKSKTNNDLNFSQNNVMVNSDRIQRMLTFRQFDVIHGNLNHFKP